MTIEELETRLRDSGIEPDVFAELLWARIRSKVIAVLRDTQQQARKRESILAAAVSGLMVGWTPECSAQRVAELAERLVDAVMRQEEERRTGA